MCCETMVWLSSLSRFWKFGSGKVKVTEFASEVTVWKSTPSRFSAGSCFIRLKLYTTSAGVNGTPSVHLTPLRICAVNVLLSFDQAHDVASHGTKSSGLRVFCAASDS